MARVKLELDSTDKILLKRHLNKNGEGQQYFTKRVAAYSSNFVPRDTGRLSTDVTIRPTSVTWNQPYAKKQYYTNRGKGVRGSYWDKRMWASKGKTIVNEVAQFCGGRSK